MSPQLTGVIIGGLIGTIGSTTLLLNILASRRRTKSICAIAEAEITVIKEKAERYLKKESTTDELAASTPMLTSIANELGYLSPKQVIGLRRCVTLDMELRKKGNKEKASATIEACEKALGTLKNIY